MTETANLSDWLERTFGNNPTSKIVGSNAVRFWEAQDEVVEDMQEFMDNWCQRRHQGTQAAIECARKIANESDAGAISQAWSDWAAGVTTRLSEDMRDQYSLSYRIMNDLVSGNGLPGMSSFGVDEAGEQKGTEASAKASSSKSRSR